MDTKGDVNWVPPLPLVAMIRLPLLARIRLHEFLPTRYGLGLGNALETQHEHFVQAQL